LLKSNINLNKYLPNKTIEKQTDKDPIKKFSALDKTYTENDFNSNESLLENNAELSKGIREKNLTSRKKNERIIKIIVFIFLTLGAILIMLPLFWMITTALKSDSEIFAYPTIWIPKTLRWDNFVKAWKAAPFTRYLFNTLFITLTTTFAAVFFNAMIAYGFAKIRFPGRKFWFSIVLGTMLIPGAVTMIPNYILFSKLRWVGTYLPLIVPSFTGSAFFIFLLRQFMLGIPYEYSEAAKIEGAGEFYIFKKIIIPLTKPALTTVAIFQFNGAWNDFMGPLLYLNDDSMYTLQIGLKSFQGQFGMEWQYFMAASLIILIPVMILFFLLQKYFIEGISMSGLKG